MDRVTDFSELPEAFAMRGENGQMIQIKAPCYNLLTPGFYGRGNNGTWYDEGEIIQADFTPNYHMQPLNRAAGKKVMAWLDSLPTAGVSINMDDMVDATVRIAKNPKLAEMTPEQITEVTLKLAIELKKKRDGTHGLALPPMAGESIHTLSAGAAKPPAMAATRYLDPSLRGPGHVGDRGVIHEPKIGESDAKRAAQFSASART